MGWEQMPRSGLLSTWGEISTAPAMAWTGQEVIVAGVVETLVGGKERRGSKAFNPATREWRDIRDPPGTRNISGPAFWGGEEMLVWPWHPDDPRHRVLAYNPTTDSWRYPPPPPMSDGTPVWLANKLSVWGGSSVQDGPYGNDAALFDPASDAWTMASAAPLPPLVESAVASDSRRVLVWGGRPSWGVAISDGAIYDSSDDTWSLTGRAPISTRYRPVSVWTRKEFIVWSGLHPTKTREGLARDGAAYDPDLGTWRRLPPAPTSGGSAAWVGNELLVFPAGTEYEPAGACLGYRPDDDCWRWVPDRGATPGAPAVWTGTELYAWVPEDPRHDLVVYRP